MSEQEPFTVTVFIVSAVLAIVDIIGFIAMDKLLESSDFGPFKYVISAGIFVMCVMVSSAPNKITNCCIDCTDRIIKMSIKDISEWADQLKKRILAEAIVKCGETNK